MTDIMEPEEQTLHAVQPAYKQLLRVRLALFWFVVAGASLALDQILLRETGFSGALATAAGLVALSVIVAAPERIYRRLRYGLTDRLLQVVRGWLFHTDTMVPLVRIQHIDVVRGPLEKLFGTATLIVHTAGTHNSTVSLPGLAPERAAEMRDIIRQHVRTDFA